MADQTVAFVTTKPAASSTGIQGGVGAIGCGLAVIIPVLMGYVEYDPATFAPAIGSVITGFVAVWGRATAREVVVLRRPQQGGG